MAAKKNLHLTLTKVFLFRKLFIENMLVKDIALEFGCSKKAVSLHIKKNGLQAKHRSPDNHGRVFSQKTKEKLRESKLGVKNPRYKNGISYSGEGYIIELQSEGGYKPIHRSIMERYLGRKLIGDDPNHKDSEIVHHIDGNVHNNAISNLQVMTRSEHTTYHNNEGILKNPDRRFWGINAQKHGGVS
jgi:hypothetical protein